MKRSEFEAHAAVSFYAHGRYDRDIGDESEIRVECMRQARIFATMQPAGTFDEEPTEPVRSTDAEAHIYESGWKHGVQQAIDEVKRRGQTAQQKVDALQAIADKTEEQELSMLRCSVVMMVSEAFVERLTEALHRGCKYRAENGRHEKE